MSEADAWQPGLQSDIPTALWPLVTLFRQDNAFVSHQDALELSDLTGLKILELISLRPERLVTHSLLVRVTADLSVQDGPNYEELGINLRGMVEQIYVKYMLPEMASITAALDAERAEATQYVAEQLSLRFDVLSDNEPPDAEKRSMLKRWFGTKSAKNARVANRETPEITALRFWEQELARADNALHQACLKALVKTVGAITGHRGRMLPDHSLVTRVVVNQVCNSHGQDVIDRFTGKLWDKAVESEGYRRLPVQAKPVVMNVKGASASGKSTIRPQQRQLSEKLGIPWEDFALISPDYWRKHLLEYQSLGDDYKYGAMLTGRELEIIDKKLDRYMAEKAANGTLSHLLIDRFRFDSFIVDVDRPADSKLLSRFGDRVFLFFMVTHPAETVSRAYERGKKTGRFKAVDDLLYHNVEAFTGMPALFLSWINSKDKRIHVEFLDNDVPLGQLPRTAALGWNETLVVLDVRLLLNIDRYRKVNIAATRPDEIFSQADLEPNANTAFIVRCAKTVQTIIFADQDTARNFATVKNGKLVWWDGEYITRHADSEGLIDVLSALGYQHDKPCGEPSADALAQIDIEAERRVTVGHWNQP